MVSKLCGIYLDGLHPSYYILHIINVVVIPNNPFTFISHRPMYDNVKFISPTKYFLGSFISFFSHPVASFLVQANINFFFFNLLSAVDQMHYPHQVLSFFLFPHLSFVKQP